jgi:hypothetical protein
MFRLLCLSLFAATIAAKNPPYNWAETYKNNFVALCGGDQKSLAHLFTPDAKVCFNGECGGINYGLSK